MYVNPLQFYTSEIIYKLMGEIRGKKMKCFVASTSTHLGGFFFVLHMQLSYLKKNKLLVCKNLEINLLFFIFLIFSHFLVRKEIQK